MHTHNQSQPPARRRRLARVSVLLGLGLAVVLPSTAVPTSAVATVQASCYDAYYFDGLTSRYSAASCANAVNAAGYAGTAYDNTSAQTAFVNSARDGVFFFAGHSLDLFDNNCSPTCTGAHSGVALAYESPNQSGSLDALAADPISAANVSGVLVSVCTEGGGCQAQPVLVAYPWGDGPQNFKPNLMVLEGCATSQDTANWVSMATAVHNAGAGTVVGFHDDIAFSVNADNSNLYGDGWANRFWSDLQSGQTYTAAAIDASNSVGNANGYGSVTVLQNPGAPASLYPAQYFLV